MIRKIISFFDKLEDKVRAKLSHTPILYAFLGGIGVTLFWRGVWHLADNYNMSAIVSIIIGSIILLITGAFVTTFIGTRLIISGLIGEKKLAEKTAEEIVTEESEIQKLQKTLNKVEEKLEDIESEINQK
ncbi:MAG: hypothetical protein NTX96_01170 [Candidatus Zambryskibacteria bacterium]|nr:hypothetical protein [Candidatus Zambryskibacteria bacterium]